MIEDGYKYVDKTDLIYKMVNQGKAYFLARPRRFGKSLLCSTIGAYFEGRRDLFAGLAVEQLEAEWIKYPVIRIDLNAERYLEIEDVHQILEKNLRFYEEIYGRKEGYVSYASRFHALIRGAAQQTGRKVVILIDEYDKPLTATMTQPDLHEQVKSALKSFYEVLKSADEHLRFTLITGVSKFSQVSLFSSLNHLEDISLLARYSTVCGLTETELFESYSSEIAEFAQSENLEMDEFRQKFKNWYNGYRFAANAPGVYNPFSTIHAIKHGVFREYWFNTATPTFLMDTIKRWQYPIPNLERIEATETQMMQLDAEGNHLTALLYQTGYLTIGSYDRALRMFELVIPNLEVREGLYSGLLDYFGSHQKAESGSYLAQMIRGLNSGDVEKCLQGLRSFLSGIPYQLKIPLEAYYHSLFYAVFSLVGTRIQAEVCVYGGRVDAIVSTEAGHFVFEFKFNQSPQIALDQIAAKGYAQHLVGLDKPLCLVGLNMVQDVGLEWEISTK